MHNEDVWVRQRLKVRSVTRPNWSSGFAGSSSSDGAVNKERANRLGQERLAYGAAGGVAGVGRS